MSLNQSKLQKTLNQITSHLPAQTTSTTTRVSSSNVWPNITSFADMDAYLVSPAEHMELGHIAQKWNNEGFVKSATITGRPSNATELTIEFTTRGIKELVLKGFRTPDQTLDVDFLEEQILEYGERLAELPKGFLEGLRAAEGILRGTDCLENHLDND